jgi:proton glutamate symport protein
MKKKNLLLSIVSNPFFLIACTFAGVYAGFYHKWMAPYLAPVAKFYTNFLQVTVIPIIVITVLVSMTKLLLHGGSNQYIMRIIGVFAAMLVTTGCLATLAGFISEPGKNMSSDPSIVKIVESSGGTRTKELTLDEQIETTQKVSIVDFLINTVPGNIFDALSRANMLQIIAFCIILTLACGAISKIDKKDRISGIGHFLPVFYKINEKVLLFLPLGSFCLLGTQLSNVSDSALGTILKLAITMLSVIILLAVICSIILWKCSSKSYSETLKALFGTLITAFSTQSSIICVPRAVTALTEKLDFDRQTVELAVPLGVPLCQFSTVCFYIIGAIFVSNIFNEKLDLYGYSFIAMASILTSFAASGAKGVIYYSLMTGILAPLGVPLGGTIALFIAVDPLVDPFGTVFHVYAICCSAAICCKLTERHEKKEMNKEKKGKVKSLQT